MLFSIWLGGQPLHRATKDLDLLSSAIDRKLERRLRPSFLIGGPKRCLVKIQ